MPLSAALLALLAIPLSSSNPRVGRSINLLVALLMFMVYSNLLSITNTWIAQQRLSFGVGVWIVHALAGAVVIFMFWRRLTLGRLLPRWRARAPAATAH
ncbi:MAG: LptF/LptG family permease [Burkholderiaceae bacterium]